MSFADSPWRASSAQASSIEPAEIYSKGAAFTVATRETDHTEREGPFDELGLELHRRDRLVRAASGCLGSSLADEARAGHRAVHTGQRHRHHGSHRFREALVAARPDFRGREPAGGRRNDRRGAGGESRARWL